MSHSTPATFLSWAILSSLLGMFLILHLYKYDKFKCLRWNNGPYSGAFKRIMTYTYMITIPLIAAYSIGFAVIKYRMGWTYVPEFGVIPTPWQLWPQKYKSAIFPLYLVFSVSWSLEMVTHLEELCFWLFLINAGRVQQDWFRSLYFKTWIVGSFVAIIYMPLVTIFTRSDPIKCEAFTFLAGSLGSLSLTLWFTPILWTFPHFLETLRKENVDTSTILKLTRFHELNSIRIVFRFMFVIPLVILGVDGVRPHQHVNDSCFWTELFAILAGIGVVVSSGITLMIFFPRSIESEYAVKQASLQKSSFHLRTVRSHTRTAEHRNSYAAASPTKSPVSYTSEYNGGLNTLGKHYPDSMDSPTTMKTALDIEAYSPPPPVAMFAPNRRLPSGATVQGGVAVIAGGLTDQNLAQHDFNTTSVHPFVHNFTSPIDLVQGDGESYGQTNRSRQRR